MAEEATTARVEPVLVDCPWCDGTGWGWSETANFRQPYHNEKCPVCNDDTQALVSPSPQEQEQARVDAMRAELERLRDVVSPADAELIDAALDPNGEHHE